MEFINIFLIIIYGIICFFIGGVYISNKDFKFAKNAHFRCENCDSLNCYYKFCSKHRGD